MKKPQKSSLREQPPHGFEVHEQIRDVSRQGWMHAQGPLTVRQRLWRIEVEDIGVAKEVSELPQLVELGDESASSLDRRVMVPASATMNGKPLLLDSPSKALG